jgi:hypothetical protein
MKHLIILKYSLASLILISNQLKLIYIILVEIMNMVINNYSNFMKSSAFR